MPSVTDLLDSASISQKVFEDYLENDKILTPYELRKLIDLIDSSIDFALANLENKRFKKIYARHNCARSFKKYLFKLLKSKRPIRKLVQKPKDYSLLCYNILSAIFICAILTFFYFKFFL